MKWLDLLERDLDIMLGKPVFVGTRITVEFVLDRLSRGANVEELIANYEGLRSEHVSAALACAQASGAEA